jgi:hypothetical protein
MKSKNGSWWIILLMVLAVVIVVSLWVFCPVIVLNIVVSAIEFVWLFILFKLYNWDGEGFIQ